MNKIIKKFIPVFIGVVVLIVSVFFTSIRAKPLEDNIALQNREITNLKNKLEIIENTVKSDTQKVLVKQTTGLDSERVDKDKGIIDNLARTLFTWHNGEQYDAVRDALVENYGVPIDSNILTTLFPAQEEFENILVKEDDSDKSLVDRYNLNSQFEQTDIHVSNINIDVYSYVVFVKSTSVGKNGGEGEGYAALLLDVNSNGEIKNLDGYTISRILT